jgi:hypothetical protein
MESYFFIPQFFLASFLPTPKLPLHTCRPFASHQCAAAHRLKIAGLETLCSRASLQVDYLWLRVTAWQIHALFSSDLAVRGLPVLEEIEHSTMFFVLQTQIVHSFTCVRVGGTESK